MVESSEMNLLFFLGVLIPAIITIALFVVFCFCWYKMRIRNEILYKKHDPHKIEKLREKGEIYEPPPPPPPPFKPSYSTYFAQTLSHNNNNINKNKPVDNYEETPEPTEGFDNPAMYNPGSENGFTDLNQIKCTVEHHRGNTIQRHHSEAVRPNSQASDDSDDSGFRSSRSGQYIHSASSSTGNAQENTHSCSMSDAVPLFKPIKIHPNELGKPPLVSYVHRNSSKRKPLQQRKPIPSSQHFKQTLESQSMDMYSVKRSGSLQNGPYSLSSQSTHAPVCQIQHISKSSNDVHGGRLHSIDSHNFPLTSIGNFGISNCADQCGNIHSMNSGYRSDGHINQPISIGYGSDMNSLNGLLQNVGHLGSVNKNGMINGDQLSYIPVSNMVTASEKIPLSTCPETGPMWSVHSDMGKHLVDGPLNSVTGLAMQQNVTQAMVHKPFVDELGDPTLFSVV